MLPAIFASYLQFTPLATCNLHLRLPCYLQFTVRDIYLKAFGALHASIRYFRSFLVLEFKVKKCKFIFILSIIETFCFFVVRKYLTKFRFLPLAMAFPNSKVNQYWYQYNNF